MKLIKQLNEAANDEPTKGQGVAVNKKGLKVKGRKAPLEVGDWVSLMSNKGANMLIKGFTDSQVRLDNGKLYGPRQLYFDID